MGIRKLTANTLWLVVLQLFNYISPLLVLPLLTRTLEIAEFGSVMVALSLAQVALVITDFGFTLSATYDVTQNSLDPDYIQRKIRGIFTAKILLCCVAVPLVLLCFLQKKYLDYYPVFVSVLPAIIAQAFLPVWLFHGLQEMKQFVIYQSLTRIIYLVMVVLVFQFTQAGYLVTLCFSFSNMIGLLVSLSMMKLLGFRIQLGELSAAFAELKSSLSYFWSRLAVATYTSAGGVLIGFVGLDQAAYFSCAEQIYKAGQAVTQPLNQALFPYMSTEKNFKLFYIIVSLTLSVLILGSIPVWFFLDLAITTFFGAAYVNAISVTQIFIFIIFINYVGTSFGYPAFAAIGKPKVANITVLFGAVVHSCALLGLYINSSVSARTVVLSVLATESVVLALRVSSFFYLKRKCASVEFTESS